MDNHRRRMAGARKFEIVPFMVEARGYHREVEFSATQIPEDKSVQVVHHRRQPNPEFNLGNCLRINAIGYQCGADAVPRNVAHQHVQDRKSTRLNSSHGYISYAVFCLKKKKITT